MTTISANNTVGIDLTTGAYSNPVVINAGVTVSGTSYAIYASSGFWTISNSGSLAPSGEGASGISLAGGGVVINQTAGVIGSIAGTNSTGIYILGGAGTVTNAGTIASVWLQTGGTVTNQAGATIVSSSTSGGYGVGFDAGGTVTNAGMISGLYTGIDASHGGGTVVNQTGGTLTGQFAGVVTGIPGSVAGGSGRYVTNAAGATISGDSGIVAGSGSTTVVNAGAITGTLAATFTIKGVILVEGAGVTMNAAGSVTNQSGGTIAGVSDGIYLSGAPGTVVNAGGIAGTGTAGRGVFLAAGGTVTNDGTATITGAGGNAVYVTGAAGTVFNAGVIMATGGTNSAIGLLHGGYISNAGTGTISGGVSRGGIYVTGAAGTVVNAGQVTAGGTKHAVNMLDGGSVTNQSGGVMTGGTTQAAINITGAAGAVVNYGTLFGANLPDGGIVTNTGAGSISGDLAGIQIFGAVGGSVTNAGSADITSATRGVLIVITGGTASVTNAASASINGALFGVEISGAPATVANYGSIVGGSAEAVAVDHGTWVTNAAGATMTGGLFGIALHSGSTLTNAGTIIGNSGTAVDFFDGTAGNLLALDPGFSFGGGLVEGNATSGNTLEMASAASAGAVTDVGSSFVNFGSITFDAGAQWLLSGSTAALAAGQTISGFAPGDTIDLVGVSETIGNFAGGTLSLTGSAPLNLSLPGGYTTPQFHAAPSSDGTAITVACFRAGTRILSARGEIPVEQLRIGEPVLTDAGQGDTALRRILWIGHRTVDCRRHPNPGQVWPVRVAAGALGPSRPHRDLFLSPDHAIFVDGALLPIKLLINGASITQVKLDEVTYYHVELPRHDVMFAEGLPCESFLATGNRANFINGGHAVALHPDFASLLWEAEACAPLIVTGPTLDAVRRLVNARVAEVMAQRGAQAA